MVKHIAIILDGNRRFARKLGREPWEGHSYGLKKLEYLFGWCREFGIKELTLYAFSTENFSRSRKEVVYIMGLFREYIEKLRDDRELEKIGARVRFIGRIGMFSKGIQKGMKELMERTMGNSKFTINFAMGYGGRAEIVDSINSILNKAKNNRRIKINEKLIKNNLYLASEPEIVIRPGGEVRTSNFLMWQSAYSEWFFARKYWPEFTKADLRKILEEYRKRERRFGT
ncbi:di-trans,poly-cis-decaprenylcistransferase [Candidatus Woesearchaeota archaeon]|nr:di-trans,poly-cis-decaprenylcistransferase [Candidatus Woesearchaeota archaeon]